MHVDYKHGYEEALKPITNLKATFARKIARDFHNTI